jgi:serine/threonine-protein kinase
MTPVSIHEFVAALRESDILEPAQANELAAQVNAGAELKGLLRELVGAGWLTPYQLNQLLHGRGKQLVIGSYVILERVGEGGMGQVFKARHRLMNRIVALKLIRREWLSKPNALRFFHREIQTAARLAHPNIVIAHDAGQVGEQYFLTMEFVEGKTLARLVKSRGTLPVSEACHYIGQAALGLHHAHEQGLVHRDIKPSNVLITTEGGLTKILDMGLARLRAEGSAADDDTPTHEEGSDPKTREFIAPELVSDDTAHLPEQVGDLEKGAGIEDRVIDPHATAHPGKEITPRGAVVGTPDYMAPEQTNDAKALDVRADIYSLGCTLYYALAGQPPFPGGFGSRQAAQASEERPCADRTRPPGSSARGRGHRGAHDGQVPG